ncbi:type II restriction endonuclease [Sphingomonas sp. Leaf37]|uniref:type II restriction endonuclease n=1 Tax=Sphingomonas sp. Leaf37 TaxID=2876552 RepID=UPI001E3CAAF3|nr:type II restriction endonuclease [Sphingomonas sp. Leaf37]
MTAQFDMFAQSHEEPGVVELAALLRSCPLVLVKKLSNNDRDWARLPNKHQAGVYISPRERDSGFFPNLVDKPRSDGGAAIRECFFRTEWPQVDEVREATRLVHYTSKGPETHLTGVPKAAFATLSPASFLVIGRYGVDGAARFQCLTIDSASDDALVLADTLDLPADFVAGVFEPEAALAAERERILDFAGEATAAWLGGTIAQFATANAALPSTAVLARMAREQYLAGHHLATLDPFLIENPGDTVREISRTIEWELFRKFQRRERAIELVRTILGDTPGDVTVTAVIRSLIDNIGEVDRLMLSASQQRKSRAGYSFEHQIEAMLAAGAVPFEKQVVMDAKKRPDFILPSLARFVKPVPGAANGLILSAKTTLRERWKQVQREMAGGDLFLATVDENVAANAIEDMATLGIVLVVPEALRMSRSTEYVRHTNVIGFGDFFRTELAGRRMPEWGCWAGPSHGGQ